MNNVNLSLRDQYDNTKATVTGNANDLYIEVEGDGKYVDLSLSRQGVEALHQAVGALFTESVPITQTFDPVSIFAGSDGDDRLAWNRVAVKAAEALGFGIDFRYAKGEDESVIETRSLDNVSVTETRDGHTLVLGEDPDRDDIRGFRLDRIKGFVTVND